MRVELAIRNSTVVTPTGRYPATIGVIDGRIAAIAEDSVIESGKAIDLAGKYLLPGLIDGHTHFRDPGFPELEDFQTGTRAAARGGFTTVLEMPTSMPGVASAKILKERAATVQPRAVVDYGLQAAAGHDNTDEIEAMAEAGAVSFKTRLRTPTPGREEAWAGQWVIDDGQYYEVLQAVGRTGRPAAVHAENWQIVHRLMGQLEKKGPIRPENISYAYPPIVEAEHVQKAILLAGAAGARLVLCHIGTSMSLEMARRAKDNGQPVVVEVAFNNLALSKDDVARYGKYVVHSAAAKEDVDAVWTAIGDGLVDQVVSDHSPFSKEMVERAWEYPGEKWFGIAANELVLPFLIRRAIAGELTLERIAEVMSESLARTYGLYPRKGTIQVGSDADFVAIDLTATETVKSSELEARTKFTMFDGLALTGLPVLTIVRGAVVMEDRVVTGKAGHGVWQRPA